MGSNIGRLSLDIVTVGFKLGRQSIRLGTDESLSTTHTEGEAKLMDAIAVCTFVTLVLMSLRSAVAKLMLLRPEGSTPEAAVKSAANPVARAVCSAVRLFNRLVLTRVSKLVMLAATLAGAGMLSKNEPTACSSHS